MASIRHSVAAALVTEVIQPHIKVPLPAEAFTAALLHDIGKLIMARFLSTDILELMHQARTSGKLTVLEAETKILQVHHGELGGIIAQHWKFPERIVRGIIYHHNPDQGNDPICDIVYVSNLGAKKLRRNLWAKRSTCCLRPKSTNASDSTRKPLSAYATKPRNASNKSARATTSSKANLWRRPKHQLGSSPFSHSFATVMLPMNLIVETPTGLGVRQWSLRNRRFSVKEPRTCSELRSVFEVPTPKR
ncbi:MAG: HDOD domain-containing protein [Verrucomicrobia bacterium]|nr:HDOD domain-containing protein [Verrucomicrobiota bacterium]